MSTEAPITGYRRYRHLDSNCGYLRGFENSQLTKQFKDRRTTPNLGDERSAETERMYLTLENSGPALVAKDSDENSTARII